MKTRATLIVSLTAILIIAAGSAFGAYSGGTGESNDPYQIATKDDLLALAANTGDYDKCFILTADVNMAGQVFTTAIIAADTSSDWGFQGTFFTGKFDGNGHKITHFTINGGDYLGLFGCINSGGSVKNLGLENFSVSGSKYVGGLVGHSWYSNISNCYSTGTVSGGSNSWAVGGLVGHEYQGSISNCYSTGAVNGSKYVGGLAGENGGDSNISNCYSTGTVNGSVSMSAGWWDTVGIVTSATAIRRVRSAVLPVLTMSAVWWEGTSVTAVSAIVIRRVQSAVVLILGLSAGWWERTAATAISAIAIRQVRSAVLSMSAVWWDTAGTAISAIAIRQVRSAVLRYVGGLVGWNDDSNISNCYSTGTVSGSSSVGGLVGLNYGSVVGSFWDTDTSGQTTSAGGTGKTTAEMKTLSTFTSAGWDFTSVWVLPLGQYPMLFLRQAGDLNYDGGVDFVDFALFAENWLTGE